MKKKIGSDISFADGEFRSYQWANGEFSLEITAWNGGRSRVRFIAFAGLSDYGVGDVSGLIEETDPSAFYNKVISRLFENIPAENPYRLFQILDLDGQPALEIVAQDLEISHEHL